MREKAQLLLESARKAGDIGSSLEAKVIFSGGEGPEKEILRTFGDGLAPVLIVSQVEVRNGTSSLEIKVEKASGSKCQRCWRYVETVGKAKTHPEICDRCVLQLG